MPAGPPWAWGQPAAQVSWGGPIAPVAALAPPRFVERLGMPKRAWGLFILALVVTVVAVHPLIAPFAALSWLLSVFRFSRTTVRVDFETITVGKRTAPLAGLDLSTLGRAGNPWPWRHVSSRFLGANPIWTKDSVHVRGRDATGNAITVNVGTNRRDELVAALADGVSDARQHGSVPSGAMSWNAHPATTAAGWYDDPWAPGAAWRWWDGARWTTYAAPRAGRY